MFDFFAASRVFLLANLPGWRLHQMAIAKLRAGTKNLMTQLQSFTRFFHSQSGYLVVVFLSPRALSDLNILLWVPFLVECDSRSRFYRLC
jgi:hypothetical protein